MGRSIRVKGCEGYSIEDEKVHTVTLNSFSIGKYEITQGQWRAVMGQDPPQLHLKNCHTCPVERVSWNDIQIFIQKLNTLTGKHYRLPTEAEWEYTARGGRKSLGYDFSGSNNADLVAWSSENAEKRTHPVGLKKPNELGGI